jgi:hypothetical protein
MLRRYLHLIFLLLISLSAAAQEIDNTTSYKSINSDKYFRLSLDNDYFSGRDQQYTEGGNFELVLPGLKHFPLTKVFINPHYSYTKYGIALEQAGYTPRKINNPEIQPIDRPFAASLFLKTFSISVDTVHKQKFATTLSTGIIGPDALGEKVQENAHTFLKNQQPVGWKYQIRDDVILNYQVSYEKQLLAFRNFFCFTADGFARVGTLSDKAGLGVTALVGYFDNPFGALRPNKKFHLFMYDRPAIDIVGYDAALEGGVFDRASPYTISPSRLNRTIFVNRVGWVLSVRRITLEYFQTYTSRQFNTGPRNKWGGIQFALNL